jgi:hypothetical protein
MQSFVVSEAHKLIFQFWKEVEEEECRCIYVLLFAVMIDNTNHNDKYTGMEHLIDIGIHITHMVESQHWHTYYAIIQTKEESLTCLLVHGESQHCETLQEGSQCLELITNLETCMIKNLWKQRHA